MARVCGMRPFTEEERKSMYAYDGLYGILAIIGAGLGFTGLLMGFLGAIKKES